MKYGIIAATLLMGGCTYDGTEGAIRDKTAFELRGEDTTIKLGIVTDKATGCEYVVASWPEVSITPRIGPDGKPRCATVTK